MTDRLPLMVAVAIATFVTPAQARAGLRLAPNTWAFTTWDDLSESEKAESAATAEALGSRGWGAIDLADPAYPDRLATLKSPPPVLFYRGVIELLHRPAIGMCGSRKASAAGLRAARACAPRRPPRVAPGRTVRPSCAHRRSPIPACRRCWTSLPRRLKTWKRDRRRKG